MGGGSCPGGYRSSRGHMLPKFGEVLGLKSPFAAEMLLLQACSRLPPSHTRGCVLAPEVMLDSVVLEMRGWRWWQRRTVGACAQGRQRIPGPPAPSPCSAGPASLYDGLALYFLTRTLTFENKCSSSPWPPCPFLSSRKLRTDVGFQTLWRVVCARRCPSPLAASKS